MDRYRSTAVADAEPWPGSNLTPAAPPATYWTRRLPTWWCTASRPGCSARSHRARWTDRTSPADDLQIGEVGLPKLVWGGRRIGEAIGRLHQDEGRARDQAMVLQEPINGGF